MNVPVALFALLAGCASARSSEVLRISATHAQSMTGVKVGTGPEAMTCARDLVTGSHILRWYCQLGPGGAQYELGVPVRLELR